MLGYESIREPTCPATAEDAYHQRRRRREFADLPPDEKYKLEYLLSRERLYQTGLHMRENSGDAAGPDGVSPSELSKSDIGRLAGLLAKAIENGTYRPGRRLAAQIPKPNGGGMRTLWIPNFADRMVAKTLLETIQHLVDLLFFETSYGFRPHRGTWLMLAMLKSLADYHRKWVIVNCDVRQAFDSIRIEDVLKAFRTLFARTEVSTCGRPTQQKLLQFIKKILQGGDPSRSVGIGTGCPFSPLALNVLLHIHHDALFQEEPNKPLWIRCCEPNRYADNLVYLTDSVPRGQGVLGNICSHLSLQCELVLKDDAEIIDLCSSSKEPVILGFALSCKDERLVFELPDEAIHRFAEHLQEAHDEPQPGLAARQIARGWASSIGPAMENGWNLLPQIARALDACGFRDVCTIAELEVWWADSCRRWRHLLADVQIKEGLLICDWE